MSEVMRSFLEHYALTENDWDKQMTESHLDTFSRLYCTRWRLLPSCLEMRSNIVETINQDVSIAGEIAKRIEFFRQWKQMKGFKATYGKLIHALVEIDCRDDAGKVCELLKSLTSTHNIQQQTSTVSSDIDSISPQTATAMVSTQATSVSTQIALQQPVSSSLSTSATSTVTGTYIRTYALTLLVYHNQGVR